MTILKIADHNGQELEGYENDKGLFYISISDNENAFTSQYITIDPLDAKKLIEELTIYIERNG